MKVILVVFIIAGSKGDKHWIAHHKDGAWTCDCSGFQHRGKCPHIRKAQRLLR